LATILEFINSPSKIQEMQEKLLTKREIRRGKRIIKKEV